METILNTPLEIIYGWFASIFCTLILVPQIIKVIQTKHTRDVSMSMLILSVVGNGFWALHASLTNNTPLLFGASLIFIMSFILIFFKFSYDTNE